MADFLAFCSEQLAIVQVVLLGDADEIVQYLCARLGKGWTLPPPLAADGLQSKSKERQALNGSIVAGAAILEEPPTLKKSNSARSLSASGGASTSTCTTDKEKGKAKSKVEEVVEPTRIGVR